MTARRKKLRKKPGWYLVLIVILVIGSYGLLKSGRYMIKIRRFSRMKQTEEKAVQKARERKKTLEIEIERLENDSTYIEEIAREEYGMKKKDEEVYRIPLPNDETKGKEKCKVGMLKSKSGC